MVIGILQVELLIEAAMSLKDKRSVVRSLKDRLHREHQVSVAEVATLDDCRTATLGIVLATNEVTHAQSMLTRIEAKLHRGPGYVMNDSRVEILTGK